MALLDKDRFEGRFRTGVHRGDTSDIMRLEKRIEEERHKKQGAEFDLTSGLRAIDEEEMDDLPDDETEELEDQVVDLASNARTIAELELEISRQRKAAAHHQ